MRCGFLFLSKFCGWGGRPLVEPQNLTISEEIALFVSNEDTRGGRGGATKSCRCRRVSICEQIANLILNLE